MATKTKDGADYAHNYDIIVKMIAAALCGETLDVLGVPSAVIEDVFGFEPVNISVKTGRVDVMARDAKGAYYHIEEQRNLAKSDLYRFAAHHFYGAGQWGPNITDVILASGDVFAGEKTIITPSGKYSPVVIDFSLRDGWQRLKEIRAAVAAGTFNTWIELVFLPLYGKTNAIGRSELVEQVIHFETDLYRNNQFPATLLAATLIMANKLIDKNRINLL